MMTADTNKVKYFFLRYARLEFKSLSYIHRKNPRIRTAQGNMNPYPAAQLCGTSESSTKKPLRLLGSGKLSSLGRS